MDFRQDSLDKTLIFKNTWRPFIWGAFKIGFSAWSKNLLLHSPIPDCKYTIKKVWIFGPRPDLIVAEKTAF